MRLHRFILIYPNGHSQLLSCWLTTLHLSAAAFTAPITADRNPKQKNKIKDQVKKTVKNMSEMPRIGLSSRY